VSSEKKGGLSSFRDWREKESFLCSVQRTALLYKCRGKNALRGERARTLTHNRFQKRKKKEEALFDVLKAAAERSLMSCRRIGKKKRKIKSAASVIIQGENNASCAVIRRNRQRKNRTVREEEKRNKHLSQKKRVFAALGKCEKKRPAR